MTHLEKEAFPRGEDCAAATGRCPRRRVLNLVTNDALFLKLEQRRKRWFVDFLGRFQPLFIQCALKSTGLSKPMGIAKSCSALFEVMFEITSQINREEEKK